MKTLFRSLGIAFIFGVIGGCGTSAPMQLESTNSSAIKRVAVVSMIGTPLTRNYIGITAFNNESGSHDISAWHLDDEYESQLRQALTKHGKFEVLPEKVDRNRFAGVYDLTGPWDAPGFRVPNPNKIAEKFKAEGARLNVDAFVLVLKSEWPPRRGVGIFVRGMGSLTNVSQLYVFASIYIIDAKSGLAIAKRLVSHDHTSSMGAMERGAPSRHLPVEMSRQDFTEFSKDQLDMLRQQFIDLPRAAWERTIRAMN